MALANQNILMGKKLLYIIIFIHCFLTGCSFQKNTFINRLYHNTTARFNAYYLAKEKVEELEENIIKDHQEDFSQVLPVFYPIDSATIESNADLINEARELASKAIDWHKISKWVDPSYFLLGKLDYYQGRFDDASNTFKYLNVNSKQKDVRHLSLIQLLRSFIDLKRFDDATFVVDYLSKEPGISQNNLQYLYKTLAYYYETRGEQDMVITALDKALENTKDKDEKSRLNFIMGQLYQRAGLDAFAYDFYQRSLSGNPPYERTFFARLYSQQVVELEKSRDLRRVRSYYDELYKDRKNIDLRDVILYEKAIFELNQGELEEAIRLLNLAAEEPGKNQRQKGYIYQKLAQIHLEEKRDYAATKRYVDLALENFRKSDNQFQELTLQKAVLDDYVTNYDLIHKNDSLLYLAQLSPEEQEAYVDQYIQGEEERLLREAEAASAPKSSNIFNSLLAFGGGGSGSNFYWDNPVAMQKGAVEFARVWGSRPLEDHWRRSNKGFQQAPEDAETAPDSVVAEEAEEERVNAIVLPDKKTLLQAIPNDEASQRRMHEELEEAYFNLGKLLFFDLNEPERSISYLEKLIEQYPHTQKKPEAYYTLHLASEEVKGAASTYLSRLKSEFPDSQFTKSLDNPGGATGNEANLAAAREYRTAYQLYTDGEYQSSRVIIRKALDEYPLTDNSERLLLLDIMISGKTDEREEYKNRLENYIQNVQDPGLYDLARNMLSVLGAPDTSVETTPSTDISPDPLAEEQVDQDQGADASNQEASPYTLNLDQTHIFFLTLDASQYAANKNLTAELENFHQQYFPNRRLRTGNISFTREHTIIIISPFTNAENALSYQREFLNSFNFDSLSEELKMSSFVISIENFQQLNKRKDIEEYKAFYRESYP